MHICHTFSHRWKGTADVTFLQFGDDFFSLVNGILEIKKNTFINL